MIRKYRPGILAPGTMEPGRTSTASLKKIVLTYEESAVNETKRPVNIHKVYHAHIYYDMQTLEAAQTIDGLCAVE